MVWPSLMVDLSIIGPRHGHKAWEKITKRTADLAKDDESVLEAVVERDEYAENPIARYCTTEEWDTKIEEYEQLNEACGQLKVEGAALVLRMSTMLPMELRRTSSTQIRANLKTNMATSDPDKAKTVFRDLIKSEWLGHKQMVKQEAKLARSRV